MPDGVVAVGMVGLAALLGSWLVAARSPRATLGLPTLVASAVLPAAVTGALNPGVLVAVGLTGLASWTYVLAASLAVAVAAVAGAGLARLSEGRAPADPSHIPGSAVAIDERPVTLVTCMSRRQRAWRVDVTST